MKTEHWAVFITNTSPLETFTDALLHQRPPELLAIFGDLKGALFSQQAVDAFIEEEVRHDIHVLNPNTEQELRTFSSGERKKALLSYLLKQSPEFLILDNPFDNLDQASRESLLKRLNDLADKIPMIQIISRQSDLLPFISRYARLGTEGIVPLGAPPSANAARQNRFEGKVPEPLENKIYSEEFLVQMKNVTISYGEKMVVRNINWNIRPGEFWQLAGPNGSGKTTLLSLITGDNPKAYGQDLYLFGYRKGSGESVWDIKEEIGYFTPAMTDRFRGYHSLEHMLISGLVDSIGLYVKPTKRQKQLAMDWLKLLDMEDRAQDTFASLTPGEKRLIMCARAMIKHPLLLILDEPTASLDDRSADIVVDLVNKMAEDSHSAIVFVSHRKEAGLKPNQTLQLVSDENGSRGILL